MPKEYINPNSLFPSLPHGFSQIVVASGKRMVFISGQTAWDERKNIVGRDSVLEQAQQAFRNLEKAMESAGGTLKDIVACGSTLWIIRPSAEQRWARLYGKPFHRRTRQQAPGSACRPWQIQNS